MLAAILALRMPSCLTLHSAPHPVPALGARSGMPGTPFCCLGWRLSHPKSSLMSPYCPALLEHNVLPLPSHPAGLLPRLYLGLSMVFISKAFSPFSGSEERQIRELQTPMVGESFFLCVFFVSIIFPTLLRFWVKCPGYQNIKAGARPGRRLAEAYWPLVVNS